MVVNDGRHGCYVGVEGVSKCRRCSVYFDCSYDGNRSAGYNENAINTSQTFGNGGNRGNAPFCGLSPGTPCVGFGSGSASNQGIIVLQWME